MTLKTTRRGALRLFSTSLAATAALGAGLPLAARAAAGRSLRQGKLFLSTNAPAGNEVLVYDRSAGAAASLLTRVSTDGAGTGGGLGSQGAVTLSRDGRYLFVSNAASNTVSTLAFTRGGLVLVSVVDSGGLMPTSVTENHGLVYVLNAGGDGNVAGFINDGGVLIPLAGSVQGLSAAGGTAPAQVGLTPNGDALIVAERNTNVLSAFAIGSDGTPSARASVASPGVTPFGFAFTRRGQLLVSEAAGGAADGSSASSYRFSRRDPATPVVVSAAVPTTQTAACWLVVTPDGRHAYTANAGSSSLSSFVIQPGGAILLLQAQAGFNGDGAGALDTAVSADGQQLHVFASRALALVAYDIGEDGALAPLGSVGGMPAGSAGLAAN